MRIRPLREGPGGLRQMHRGIEDGPPRHREVRMGLRLLPRIPGEEGEGRGLRQRDARLHRRRGDRRGRSDGRQGHRHNRRGPAARHGQDGAFHPPPEGEVRPGPPHPPVHGDRRPGEGEGPRDGRIGRAEAASEGRELVPHGGYEAEGGRGSGPHPRGDRGPRPAPEGGRHSRDDRICQIGRGRVRQPQRAGVLREQLGHDGHPRVLGEGRRVVRRRRIRGDRHEGAEEGPRDRRPLLLVGVQGRCAAPQEADPQGAQHHREVPAGHGGRHRRQGIRARRQGCDRRKAEGTRCPRRSFRRVRRRRRGGAVDTPEDIRKTERQGLAVRAVSDSGRVGS